MAGQIQARASDLRIGSRDQVVSGWSIEELQKQCDRMGYVRFTTDSETWRRIAGDWMCTAYHERGEVID